MPRMKKKGQAGAAKNYVTRNQAVRKLQLSLPDFRKLCIWKGIYPREPRSRKKVSKSSTASTTFYYAKDIQYLLHEPLVGRFRDHKALEKKISKALGRGDVSDAKRLETNAIRPERTGKPRYTLDHVIRERYPTFTDALRDLDDCLSMLFLFANLPSTTSVPAKMVARCARLCHEFQHYLIVTASLTKSFLSIKGIYYQANIQGEDILWLVPYRFNQRIVGDIDFRIMGTFVEFYMTLLGFVNFRLFTSIGLKYPPKFDATKDENSAELGAFTLEGSQKTGAALEEPKAITDGPHKPDAKVQAAVNKVLKTIKGGDEETMGAEADEQTTTVDLDKFEPAAKGGDVLPQPMSWEGSRTSLFAGLTFYLSRETPRQPLEFLLKAFGCKRIGWDATLGGGAYTTDELDASITHQIVDRPPVQNSTKDDDDDDGDDDDSDDDDGGDDEVMKSHRLAANRRVPGRIYVQPQWVWDSVNDEELKEPHLYAPGASLPPHLSPFVRLTQGAYDPTMPLEDQEPEAEALQAEEDEDDVEGAEGMDVAGSEDEDEDEDENEEGEDDQGDGQIKDDRVVEDEEEGDEDEAATRQRELEAELVGAPVKAGKAVDGKTKAREEARRALSKKAREEAEELDRAKGMLSKKKRKLFEQMIYSNSKKSAEDQKLRAKRRKLEKEKARKKGGS
ncbi:hypothetical protein L249_0224 [Ophiocordyceps polyrhachis-furcata BCC 54312]|uniref:Pescadillo homolog n=1 Tax=Ophiocordyceps polyrhachis-furcata BCC 54312 TaxID=1330021 RepID=A0A367LF90_9HYPO|nr:hypothetical protein L249_0224 [Ophiocordyceps polyrhachis-furcata BCC 54312]